MVPAPCQTLYRELARSWEAAIHSPAKAQPFFSGTYISCCFVLFFCGINAAMGKQDRGWKGISSYEGKGMDAWEGSSLQRDEAPKLVLSSS